MEERNMIKIPERSLIIRPVTDNELDAVLEVYRQCEDFLALGPVPHASMEMVITDLETTENEDGQFCGIFTNNSEMLGIAEYIPAGYQEMPSTAFLSLLMIKEQYRDQGIGKAVVEAIEKEIRKNPEITVILSGVQINNLKGIQFWERNGYRIVSAPKLLPDMTTVYDLRKDLISSGKEAKP
jgi:ribosomal protein S18 acetylase RimI-like enzyme